jgi:hypothetical protein
MAFNIIAMTNQGIFRLLSSDYLHRSIRKNKDNRWIRVLTGLKRCIE